MSSAQVAPSPRAPRNHQPSPRNANQAPNNTNGNNGSRGQRKPRGNRAQDGRQANGQHGRGGHAVQDPAHSDSAVIGGEGVAIPSGSRSHKKHTRAQPSGERVFSPGSMPTASLTDSEIPPTAPTGTPAKAQGAYAGPTFHASPAPSSLPIPKFLSKSVPPTKAQAGPPTPPPEGSDSGSSPSPSPSRGSIPIPSRQQDSPLDMLFKADRAEKARNVNCSPLSGRFASFGMAPDNARPENNKHDSFGSLNAPFPIELDGNTRSPQFSPPGAHRSVTAPSNIPHANAHAQQFQEPDAVQDLFRRVSMTQNRAAAATPPKPTSGPLHHSPSPFHNGRPSPFRSSSGPTVPASAPPAPSMPAAPPQEGSDLFYGNQNLSSKFKAAKMDLTKRNSGLRTEITAESPNVPHGNFPSNNFTNNDMRGLLGNALNAPNGPRRGSAPHVAPIPHYRGPPNNQHAGSPARRGHHPQHRPDSFAHTKSLPAANPGPAGTPPSQKSSNSMAFVPSSVRAKPASTPPKKAETDTQALEQNLKRLLNLGDMNGGR